MNLDLFKKAIHEKIDKALIEIAEVGADEAKAHFGNAVTMEVTKESGHRVSLTGKGEQIGFLEFGTGMYADESHPFANSKEWEELPVHSGSWSMSDKGAGLWAKFSDHPEDFPYNRLPKRGMLHAADRMRQDAFKIIKRIKL